MSEEDIELADDGEECLFALLEDFLLFLDLFGFFAAIFLSLHADRLLSELGSHLPRLVLRDFRIKEGGPPEGAVSEASGRLEAN